MTHEIEIPSGERVIRGILAVPERAKGLIIFAHGSGSSRLSPRNAFVAQMLQQAGFATLLIDLLTEEEESNRVNVFDIALLAQRLQDATAWSQNAAVTRDLPIGYFGASTGAAAALAACAGAGSVVSAVVSRGGRPDLAFPQLVRVKAPTLLIVGGNDEEVIEMNKTALRELTAEKKMAIVPGATHLFEEPGTLEEVAHLAIEWFGRYLAK